MHISLVVAMAADRVIGKDNAMPWHLPSELKYFKDITMGKPMVMGRRTYESIGRPLPGRHNIVLTRQNVELPPEVSVVRSIEEALQTAGNVDEVMVIGGGEIYRQFLPLATRLYITQIDLHVEGDTRFPEYESPNQAKWAKTLLREQAAINAETPGYCAYLLEKYG